MRYELDPERSTVDIHASSSVHPIHTKARVSGWFEATFEGDGGIDGSAPLGGYIEFDLSRMRSGNPLVDRESERRLQVRRYPTVSGELTALSASAEPDAFAASGELTFHGVTREIRGMLRIERSRGELTLSGSTTIDVTDFDVQPPSLLVIKVHKEVRVELAAIARPAEQVQD
ncbi:MAG: YceI family protein [Actinobacteria bacterium]|nr:YceI family protein [Actinomycetota bacterium]